MPFKNILVALDGSKFSELAAQYSFLLADKLGAQIAGQHVIDPRMADAFIEPEFARELGQQVSNDALDKIMDSLHSMGNLILDLFAGEAQRHGHAVNTFRDEGYILYEIFRRIPQYDLIIVGHRGRGERKLPTELLIGSIAERVVLISSKPVLVAANHPATTEQILVAFDGSEPSVGALLMAEQLAVKLGLPFKALTVAGESSESQAQARYMTEQGEKYLKEHWEQPVFSTATGIPAKVLLERAADTRSLLVLGAYGFKSPDSVVMGTTATHVIRTTRNTLLIYR